MLGKQSVLMIMHLKGGSGMSHRIVRMEPRDDSAFMESLQNPLAPRVATFTPFSRIQMLL